jgi:DNA-binding NarL/FixJ family response regulator
MRPEALRVLVVDDHSVVRRGTRRILEEAGIEVVGEAATAEQALEMAEHAASDVVLADVRLPGMSGIELITELRRHRPEIRVLVLSSYGDPGYVRAALEAGAAGYMLKTASDEELISAVRSAALGATIVDAAVSADLFSASARSPQALTDREREIVGLVTKGLPNKAIAHSLTVSKRTVDAHLAHLFTKLGVSSRAELVAWAARHGMIEP